MKFFNVVSVWILCLGITVQLVIASQSSNYLRQRELGATEPPKTNPPPKKPKNETGGGGGSGGGDGSGGGGGGGNDDDKGGSGGGGASGGDSGSGGGGDSGSGGGGDSGSGGGGDSGSGGGGDSGSGGGGDSGSGGGGDSGSGGGGGGGDKSGGDTGSGGSDGYHKNDVSSIESHANQPHHRPHAGALGLVASAVVIGAAIAAVVTERNRPTAVKAHPLKGSLNQRIRLFERLAGHAQGGARPARLYEVEMGDNYRPAPDEAIV